MNRIGTGEVLAAAHEVRDGVAIPLSRPMETTQPVDWSGSDRQRVIFEHEMLSWWPSVAGGDVQASSDRIHLNVHGMVNTHLDALCHVGFRGRGFDGTPFEDIVGPDGARRFDVTAALSIVARGYLVDAPAIVGREYLEPGCSLDPDLLRAAAPDLRQGDVLILRTGRWVTPHDRFLDRRADPDPHGRFAGLDESCLEYLDAAGVSVIGTDGPGDTFPSRSPECPEPVHVLALAFYGIHLVHSMDLERLASECASRGRSTFLFVAGALNVPGATGSPITPVAVL